MVAILTVFSQRVGAQNFVHFLQDIQIQALKNGISQHTLDWALSNLSPDPKVLALDQKQPEFSITFGKYLTSRMSQTRIDNARKNYKQHFKKLDIAEKKYGVSKNVLLAFWGLETNFGNNTGGFNLIRSLATLAFDPRRSKFFTKELLFALQLIDQGKIPQSAQSSWAGAMGYMQFMPSNVATYAKDENNNGLNLWGDLPDVFGSGANFLQKIGWHKGERWGREVILPANFDYANATLKNKQPLSFWQNLGVRTTQKKDLPNSQLLGAIILPAGHKGPAFMVYRNFYAILNWNRSSAYALSVGLLADRIVSDTALHNPPIISPYLKREQIKTAQEKLNLLRFASGKPDGIIGSRTRSALRLFQQKINAPADGHLTHELLTQILMHKL